MANQQTGQQTNQSGQPNYFGGQTQNQNQWGMGGQGQFGGSGYGTGYQGAGMYDPASWGIGNPAGGPYSGPNQGYGANWYAAPRYGGFGGYGYGNQGYGGYGYGYGQGQWGNQGFGGLGQPVTETITEWWLIPGPATGMGPQNTQRADQRVEEDVCDRLTAHGHLDARTISVSVKDGEVTLTGTVDSRQAKRVADQIADGVAGVKDVHNQLRVQPQQGQQQQQHQSQTQQTAKTH